TPLPPTSTLFPYTTLFRSPKLPPQETARRLLTGRFFSGSGRKYSATLPNSPAPKEVRMKGASLRSRTLTGRSVRNCLRFASARRSEEHTSELQSRGHLVCR